MVTKAGCYADVTKMNKRVMFRPRKNVMNPLLYRPPTIEELELKAYRPPPAPDGGPNFMFDGNVLTHSEFKYFLANVQEPVIVAGSVSAEPNLVHLFDSRDAFEDWGSRTYLAYCFERMNQIIYRFRHPEPGDSRRPGVGFVSNLPIGRDINEMPVVWPLSTSPKATLYDGKNFSGREVSFGVSAVADLGDFAFSDIASSARVRGVLMLSDRVNFGGYRFYVTGEPRIDVADMTRWGFDKAARSAILI